MAEKRKILVVDDEFGVRHFLEKVLRHDGHEVLAVESGEAALEHLADEEFDLAVVDLKLKGISGMEVVTGLKRRWPATSVIVLTAHASMETAVEALRQGAHDYLFKPCATPDLRESVRTGLLKRDQAFRQADTTTGASSGTPPIPQQAAGDPDNGQQRAAMAPGGTGSRQPNSLVVDHIRHIITLEGRSLELSPTEFGVLAYLVAQAPRVVPPRELVHEVLGYQSDSGEARDLMRSHIYHIRQKAEAMTGRDVIRTVRGVGYALQD